MHTYQTTSILNQELIKYEHTFNYNIIFLSHINFWPPKSVLPQCPIHTTMSSN